jgi:hypothetical protein
MKPWKKSATLQFNFSFPRMRPPVTGQVRMHLLHYFAAQFLRCDQCTGIAQVARRWCEKNRLFPERMIPCDKKKLNLVKAQFCKVSVMYCSAQSM